MRFPFLLAFFLLVCAPLLGQKPIERIVLKNKTVWVGKILSLADDTLRLRKFTYEEVLIPFSDIDTIYGSNYKTRMFSLALGAQQFNYYSPFLGRNQAITGVPIQLRYGKLKYERLARFYQLTVIPQSDFSVYRLGAGVQYYFVKKYYAPANIYVGFVPELNTVRYNNVLFVTLGTQLGASLLVNKKLRLFGELSRQRSIFNSNDDTSWNMLIGIRFNREFLSYYQRLNATIR